MHSFWMHMRDAHVCKHGAFKGRRYIKREIDFFFVCEFVSNLYAEFVTHSYAEVVVH